MRRAVGRSAFVASAALAVMLVSMPLAAADDLSDVLDRARQSTYTATRLTVSVWGNQSQITKERVEHADGAEMVRVDETWSMIGNGKTISMDDTPGGVAFMASPEPISTNRYRLGASSQARHMHRLCTIVPILEDGQTRAHVLVDDRTGAPLITYLYDGNGDVYRTISLSDFTPHRTYEWPQGRTEVPVEVVLHADEVEVPVSLSGYELVDAFAGPAGSQQGYYSDGLFGFSLFLMPRSALVSGFDEPMAFIAPSGVYDMVPTAKDVRLRWSDGDRSYVLVGDLPPDHLQDVLGELPEPGSAGMFARWWRALFG